MGLVHLLSALVPRAFDLALAASIAWWGAAGWWSSADPWHPVPVCILALQACVSLLLLFRRPESRAAPISALIQAGPAVLIGAIVLGAAPPVGEWPLVATAGFVAGTGLACASLLRLGRSFAVLPGVRRVVTGGPYSFVRHPAYLGEGIMVSTAAIAVGGASAAVLIASTAALLCARILAEERVLAAEPSYRSYARTVRWRLLPGLW